MDKTYFEIKITFIHILILVVAVVLLGVLLFYMGYRAGFHASGSTNPKSTVSETGRSEDKDSEVQTIEEKPVYPQKVKTNTEPAPESLKTNAQSQSDQKDPISKPILPPSEPQTQPALSAYAIRVGAFSNPVNARTYSEKFKRMGLEAHVVNSESSGNKLLFHVLVGRFSNMEKAKAEKEKLEKQEKKKFLVVPYQ